MPHTPIDFERLVSTALSKFRPGVVSADDLRQESWVAALQAQKAFDPAKHRCSPSAFIVKRTQAHLSRVIARAARAAGAGALPPSAESGELPPPEGAMLAEAIAREESKAQAKRKAR